MLLQQAANHIQFQLPNENTRVKYLLEAIVTSDAPLQAAMALVKNDTAATGKMNDFESAAAFLLPEDPVAKRKTLDQKREIAEISGLEGVIGSTQGGGTTKASKGKTGVELRFYKQSEYGKLTDDQKMELKTWRMERNKKTKEKRDKGDKRNSLTAKAVVKALQQLVTPGGNSDKPPSVDTNEEATVGAMEAEEKGTNDSTVEEPVTKRAKVSFSEQPNKM